MLLPPRQRERPRSERRCEWAPAPCVEPDGGGRRLDRHGHDVARESHARLGPRRLDRGRSRRLHPRQRRRRVATRSLVGSRAPSPSCSTGTPHGWWRTMKVTSAVMAPRAPGSCVHWHPSADCTRCACSVPALPEPAPDPRRPTPCHRPGLPDREPEPVDDEAEVRRAAARAGRYGLLPAHGARCLGAQHAGGELPVALRLGDLRRQPRGSRPSRLVRKPGAARGVLRAGRRSGRGVARRRHDALHAGTASPRRTSRPSQRWCSRATPT